jgi:hypothetical protein
LVPDLPKIHIHIKEPGVFTHDPPYKHWLGF